MRTISPASLPFHFLKGALNLLRFIPALILALVSLPIAAAEQTSATTKSADAPASLSMRSSYPEAKAGPQGEDTLRAAPDPIVAVDPCDACKAAMRESMRGPKGGYRVQKGTTYFEIERKITDACRLFCAEQESKKR